MRFETLAEGWVAGGESPPQSDGVAIGPRIARLPDGTLLCSYMRQSAVGVNDFVPHVAHSPDGGVTWNSPGPVWPNLVSRWSLFVSVSCDPHGRAFLYGSRTPIDQPGESLWSDATQGLKQNEPIWALSSDKGAHWSDPFPIGCPTVGSVEAAGPICITRGGRWLAVYAPYNSFDPKLVVARNQVVVQRSDDEGASWQHSAMLRFPREDAGGAESWVAELSDGRLVGTAWNVDLTGKTQYPNAFAISHDAGVTWSLTRSTGVMGQSTALCPLDNGRALFVYNQRQHGEPGVWIAVARPTETDFGIEHQQIAWKAGAATRTASSGDHDNWTDFAFGEPSVTVLPNGELLLVLWCLQPEAAGIRFVHLRLV